jgi:hypothetical protein
MQHAYYTPDEPEQTPSAGEIAAEREPKLLQQTIDDLDHMEASGGMVGFDVIELMSMAYAIDGLNRKINATRRRQEARHRLCRIIAKQYTRAVITGDCGECDRLADALKVATMDWCGE